MTYVYSGGSLVRLSASLSIVLPGVNWGKPDENLLFFTPLVVEVPTFLQWSRRILRARDAVWLQVQQSTFLTTVTNMVVSLGTNTLWQEPPAPQSLNSIPVWSVADKMLHWSSSGFSTLLKGTPVVEMRDGQVPPLQIHAAGLGIKLASFWS